MAIARVLVARPSGRSRRSDYTVGFASSICFDGLGVGLFVGFALDLTDPAGTGSPLLGLFLQV